MAGLMLISIMPPSGLDEAFEVLRDIRVFHLENLENQRLLPPQRGPIGEITGHITGTAEAPSITFEE
jgi:hypothetical protein